MFALTKQCIGETLEKMSSPLSLPLIATTMVTTMKTRATTTTNNTKGEIRLMSQVEEAVPKASGGGGLESSMGHTKKRDNAFLVHLQTSTSVALFR